MPEPADGVTSTCLDDRTMAAFIDGRVTLQERQRVEEHLGTCEDCYTLFAEVLHSQSDIADDVPKPVPFPIRQRTVLAAAGALALAASLLFFVYRPISPLAPMVSIVGTERLTVARPTGGFQYGGLRTQLRSGQGQDRLALLAEVGRLQQKAASGVPADVHAWGVAQLLVGRTAESVRTLESAVNAAPDEAAHHADLGAARLTMFLEQGRASDGEAALASLDRAIALDGRGSEARFNRALLLGALGRTADAVAAWNEYLAIDSDSPWADEARRQRDALKKSMP